MRPTLLVLGTISLASCAPDVPSAGQRRTPAPDVGAGARLEAVPPLDANGAVLPVTQLVVRAERPLDPSDVSVVEGDVSDEALRGFAAGAPPATTSARLVPADAFLDDEGGLVVAPRRALAIARHTVVLASLRARLPFTVRPASVPVLARTFPPASSTVATTAAMFCADAPLPPSVRALGRLRAGAAVRFERGAFGDPAFDRCVTATATTGTLGLPVALYADGATIALLDPTALGGAEAPPGAPDASCGDAIAVGPTCLLVDDDRVTLSPRATPPLLALAHAGDRSAFGVLSSPLVVRGLAPSSSVTFAVRFVDVAGRVVDVATDVLTGEARPHVVLNEVYAHPLGPEPTEEWLELVNDGATDVDLASWALLDDHGTYALPPVVVAAGAFALIVNEGFAPDALDVAPAMGTTLVRIPHLGKYGLANKGAALALAGPGGLSSKFPARASVQGQSIARARPESPDDDASWHVAAPTPGAPNR